MPSRQCLPISSRLLQQNVLPYHRLLHTTVARKSSHYEVLGLDPNASPGKIKKQFYFLSKKHHPDHNPDDPLASERFMKVSEAYATLSSPDKRQRYDRDILSASAPSSSSSPIRPGSYSSASSPVGARPASGLSRRRAQFRGPPPSFYRNGEWGSHGQKGRAQTAETAQRAHARAAASAASAAPPGESTAAGMGPGQEPGPWQKTSRFDNDVPHFDHEGHLRTQEQQELRRRRRMREQSVDYEDGGSLILRFLLISGTVTLAVAPFMIFREPLPKLSRSTRREAG